MAERTITYTINDPVELNLSYMPFIINGGLFVPSFESFVLGENVIVDLIIPARKEPLRIDGKVVWITPSNALHHVLSGIGVQFVGANAANNKSVIETHLDTALDIGGYTYGINWGTTKQS